MVDQALENLHEVKVPKAASSKRTRPPLVSEKAPDFVQKVTAVMLAGKGDLLPVSGPARALAILEAVTGQMYIAVFVARLVGLHAQHRKPTS